MARLRTAILISGRGSNMQALVDTCADPTFPAEIVLVLSNRADAPGLDVAAAAGVPTAVVGHRDHPDRAAFEEALQRTLDSAAAELVCLAGFMRLLSGDFVRRWHDRIVNIHPSLLPAFKGLDAHAQALAAGVKITGCTVHFVRPEMDAGPIIVQAAVAVAPDDDIERLAARILTVEHRCYPLALRLIAEGRVQVEGERVVIDDAAGITGVMINPAG